MDGISEKRRQINRFDASFLCIFIVSYALAPDTLL